MLQTITQFRLTHFEPKSRPSVATVINRIKSGIYYGEYHGIWYVDLDRPPQIQPVNELVSSVLDDLGLGV